MVSLLVTTYAFTIPFMIKFFNIGGWWQMLFGGAAASAAVPSLAFLGLPSGVYIPLLLVIGAVAGDRRGHGTAEKDPPGLRDHLGGLQCGGEPNVWDRLFPHHYADLRLRRINRRLLYKKLALRLSCRGGIRSTLRPAAGVPARALQGKPVYHGNISGDLGIRLERPALQACLWGAAIRSHGAAGAYIPLVVTETYSPDLSAGRGFMAIGIAIFAS